MTTAPDPAGKSAPAAPPGKHALLLGRIYRLIKDAAHLDDVVFELQQLVLELTQAERLTIYRREGNEIVSAYHTIKDLEEPIRVPIGPSSISGYVAMSGTPLTIEDVYHSDALRAIHPKLAFDYSFDQMSGFTTTAMVVVPILHKATPMGVLQLINHRGGGSFAEQDAIHATAVARLLAEKFRAEFQPGSAPLEGLVHKGLVTAERFEELENEARTQSLPVTILLRHEEKIPLNDIGVALQEFYQLPFMAYDATFLPDQELLESLNRNYLAANVWVPFRTADGQVVVLLDDPNNADRNLEIHQLLNSPKIEFRIGTREDIMRYLGFPYAEDIERKKGQDIDQIIGQLKTPGLTVEGEGGAGEEELYDENASSIIQLVNRIIIDAVQQKASDIHIEPGQNKENANVRVRIDGDCHDNLQIPYTHIRAVIARIKVLSQLDITEKRKPQDGKMGVTMEGQPLELRVAIVPTVNGESAVLRILASGKDMMTIDKLNMTARNQEKLRFCLEHPHGIFLCVGPTGSGKTTTLHGLLHELNTIERKIVTAEDPVEISQDGLQQLQVNTAIDLTFAEALRTFLRCSPDIILIGEMRDYETAHTGTQASLTGHLVFSTLHTNSAAETIIRLLDLGLDPLNFADALLGILAQRLVKTLCKRCKQEYRASAEEAEKLVHYYGPELFDELGLDRQNLTLWRPVGCDACGKSGYKSRTGIHELMVASPELKRAIARRGTVPEIRKIAMEQGMRSLYQDGIAKILKGDFDLVQLRKVVIE